MSSHRSSGKSDGNDVRPSTNNNDGIPPVQPQPVLAVQQAPAPQPSTPDFAAMMAAMQQRQAAETAQLRAAFAAAQQPVPSPTSALAASSASHYHAQIQQMMQEHSVRMLSFAHTMQVDNTAQLANLARQNTMQLANLTQQNNLQLANLTQQNNLQLANLTQQNNLQLSNLTRQSLQTASALFSTPPTLSPLPISQVEDETEALRAKRDASLARVEALEAQIQRMDAEDHLRNQVLDARSLAAQLWDPLVIEADRVILQNVEQLRSVELTAVNNVGEAAVRAVHRVYHLAIIRRAREHRRNLDTDAAEIRSEIDRWSIGQAAAAAIIEADFRNQASKRQTELASLLTETAQQMEYLLGWVRDGGMPPDEWLYIRNEGPAGGAAQPNTNQLPPIIFININVNGPQSVALPIAEVFPALPASRRVIELVNDVDTAGASNAEEDGITAVVRSAPTDDNDDDRDLYD